MNAWRLVWAGAVGWRLLVAGDGLALAVVLWVVWWLGDFLLQLTDPKG